MALRQLPESERRWLRALLVLGTLAVALLLIGEVGSVILNFSDILVILGLAWLLAFIVSPLVDVITRNVPAVPRTSVVVAVYILLFVLIVIVIGLIVGTIATGIRSFADALPKFQSELPATLKPWQDQLSSLGIQVDVQNIASTGIQQLGTFAGTLATQLGTIALSTFSIVGNVVIIVFLSVFIVIDKGRMVAFLNRLVPPRWSDEANLFQESVSIAFGGFLRGQAILGVIYGLFAAVASAWLNIPFLPVTSVAVAGLQMIPFFGPFISWAPPVLAAHDRATQRGDPDLHHHVDRLVRRDEHPPAAPHVRHGRHPPGGRAGVGVDRLEAVWLHRRHLRDPDRLGDLDLLLLLPPAQLRRRA